MSGSGFAACRVDVWRCVGGSEEGVRDLAGAGVWGLVRSAQSESPGGLCWWMSMGSESSWGVLGGALGLRGEPQLASVMGLCSFRGWWVWRCGDCGGDDRVRLVDGGVLFSILDGRCW